MKRNACFGLILVSFLFLLSSCATIAGRQNLREAVPAVARQSLRSVVMVNLTSTILADDKKTEISEEFSGTGFFIEYGGGIYIVSAGHLAEEDPSGVFSAETVGGKKFPLKLLYYKGGYDGDFALFSFDSNDSKGMDITLLKLGNTPKVGDWVISLGSPYGFFPFFTVGVVSSGAYDPGDGFVYVLHSAEINPGNSGGPLLDLSGRVVGINIKGMESTAISLAVPVARIKTYVREALGPLTPKK